MIDGVPRGLWPVLVDSIANATLAELEVERQWLQRRLKAVEGVLARRGPPPRRWKVLADLVMENGWSIGVEVGVFKGSTFLYLLENCPDLHLTGVDPWGPSSRHDMESYYESLMFASGPFGERAKLLRMKSLEAAPLVSDGSLDFVFIDGNHGEKYVREDIAAWRPKVKPGGWLLGHDCNLHGVRAAIDDLCPGWTKHECVIWSQIQ